MIILDTDHLSELQMQSALGIRLRSRLDAAPEELATTIISAEEQMRGWLDRITRRDVAKDPAKQVPFYHRLASLFDFYAAWIVLPFDAPAAAMCASLKARRVGLKSMDLKIASVVLSQGAKLLSSNLKDFRKVPELVVEDWLRG